MRDQAAIDRRAATWGIVAVVVTLTIANVGSGNLRWFDAALVGYTFASLFAAFAIAYRYAMWLQRPPTRLYWRRGWQVFANPRNLGQNLLEFVRRLFLEFALNRFIFRRGHQRGLAHWLIMWGCTLAALITFPLVFGWISFGTLGFDYSVSGPAENRQELCPACKRKSLSLAQLRLKGATVGEITGADRHVN